MSAIKASTATDAGSVTRTLDRTRLLRLYRRREIRWWGICTLGFSLIAVAFGLAAMLLPGNFKMAALALMLWAAASAGYCWWEAWCLRHHP